jgi:lysozyme
MLYQLSEKGIDFIAGLEGFREHPYQDTGGLWTVGYGTRIASDKANDPVTRATARAWLERHANDDLTSLQHDLGGMWLQQCQVDAIASFVYNAGYGALETTGLKDRLAKRDPDIWSLWRNAYVHDNKGVQLIDLIRRRRVEAKLFIYGIYQ